MSHFRVLVTGFGPFGSCQKNPSGAVAESVDHHEIGGDVIRGVVLPVSRTEAPVMLLDAVRQFTPEVVIVTGVASGRPNIAVERFAVNVLDFPFPDEGGEQPVDEAAVENGPVAYRASIPLKAVVKAWREVGIGGYVSNTAGTFLCNQIFYNVMHSSLRYGYRAGLIHLPSLPSESTRDVRPEPSMRLDEQRRAVLTAIETILQHSGNDISFPAGATC
jgi:pyroglutamyl-peptidase